MSHLRYETDSKIAIGAIAALCVCSCEKGNGSPADELLATITDKCISYGGVEYRVEGYIRRTPVENGVENWIVDLGGYDE